MDGCNRSIAKQIWATVAAAVFVLAAWTASAAAQSAGAHHELLGGPWEVLVKMGLEGEAMRMPVSVADENKPQTLNTAIPVMGTPIKIQLERYLPDVQQEISAVDDPNGGPVAKLSLKGENLQQEVWLSARDREKQSVSAPIGSVAIRELPSPPDASVLKELTEPDVVGLLLVWPGQTGAPLMYTVKPGKTITLPDSSWKLSIARYVPHYSIDKQTKKVTSVSDKPENPAIEIRAQGNGQEYDQWLWAQFAMVPHKMQRLPFQARFLDFHVAAGSGRYILAMAPGPQSHLLYLKDGKKCIEPVEIGKRYPFEDKKYSFGIEQSRSGARLESVWKNGKEMLLRPAIVASIVQGDASQQVVLELGQPCHQKMTVGTLVALYRHVP